ncbi:MAG: FecR domain-containing protein [Halopseudomonas sp.]|uniref:FecR domain-containing protein n=1 Tax=Halopseudomonas sp. TaxID=2901191 RepID=UPI00300157C1
MHTAAQTDQIIPTAVVRAAIEWRLKLDTADNQALVSARIQRWCKKRPEHALAWQRLGNLQAEFAGYAATLPRRELGIPLLQRASVDLQRRRALKLLTLAVAVGGPAGWLASQNSRLVADYSVGTGERRHITLADGSQLLLNTGSAVDVRFSATQRLLVLREGEVQIHSSADPDRLRARPLRVECRHGWCESDAGRFLLRDQGSYSELQLQEGTLALATYAGEERLATVGQQYQLHPGGIETVTAPRLDPAAWTRGMLVVNDIRLGDFVRELARYRNGIIGCDPAVAELLLSGVFQLADQDALLDNLSRSLPVRIVSRSRYWVRVVAAPELAA